VIPGDWTPHRRSEDAELVGWIRPEGEAWVAVDLLGRDVSDAIEWLDAEEVLERGGLAWLAEIWMLERADAEPLRVRIGEVVPGVRVGIHTDDFGAIDVPVDRFELAWPAPSELRLRRPGEHGASPWG
jgi:hypothetical protein